MYAIYLNTFKLILGLRKIMMKITHTENRQEILQAFVHWPQRKE